MSVVGGVVLGIVGLLLLLLPLLRARFVALRIGPVALRFSQPVDFGRPGPAILSLGAGLACLVAAFLVSDLPARLQGDRVAMPTPPTAEEIGFVQVDEDTGRVTVRLFQPDTMAGHTVAEAAADLEATVTAEALFGPVNAVSCIGFRVTGTEIGQGESYRAPGTFDWPRTGYLFCVSHLGVWALSRFDDGVPTYLVNFQEHKAIRKTTANRFTVRAEGDTFALSINDVPALEIADAAHAVGNVQVTCGTPMEAMPAAVCHFDDIEVKSIP